MTGTRRLRDALAGVGITPATPFTSNLASIDLNGMQGNIEYLLDRGAGLLYPCGNTGEFTSLSLEEWTSIVELTVAAAAGRAVVAPGVGGGFSTAREMLRRAADLGADGALVMPPHPVYLSDEGVVEYYGGLAAEAPVPVVAYKRGGWPSDDALIDMVREAPIAGVKYAEPDVSAFARCVAESGPDVVWTCGIAERYAPFFADAGGRGFTSGLANVAPHLAHEMQAAIDAGDRPRALEIRDRCLAFEEVRARHRSADNVPAVKVALDARGLAGGSVRPPLRDLDSATVAEVEATVRDWFTEEDG